jgi:CRISPR-associated protein Csm4
LPRPFTRVFEEKEEVATAFRKSLKKASWLHSQVFATLLGGKSLAVKAQADKATAHSVVLDDKAKAVVPAEHLVIGEKLVDEQVRIRIRASRFLGETDTNPEPYYVAQQYFGGKNSDAGLYFIVQYNSPIGEKLLDAALKHLADNGLGTDRSVGNGQFCFAKDTLELQLPEQADGLVALGCYLPQSHTELKSMLGEGGVARYNLVKRGGWISTYPINTYWKKSVYMFEPGSVFVSQPQANSKAGLLALGRTVDLTPDILKGTQTHPILRSGHTLFLPIQLNSSKG